MTKLRTRMALPSDAFDLGPRLRDNDKRELLASGSPSPQTSLLNGVMLSIESYTVWDEEGPQLMMGVVPSKDPLVGFVWMLSSDFLYDHRRELLKETPRWIERFHERFPVLTNMVDARNEVHIRWLRRHGFTFINTVTSTGPGNHPFHIFVRLHHV